MEPFEHSQTHKLTEADYTAIHALGSRRARNWKILLLVAAGLGCLFWSYTLLLGIVLLVLVALALAAPHLVPAGASATFRGLTHLHQPVTFTVSHKGLAVLASDLDLRCGWSNLAVWHEREGWLRLSPHGMQDLYFRVSDLHKASVYEGVIELCRKHGREYNGKEKTDTDPSAEF